ncbi:MAG: DUF4112 domain-containing protein [Synechococcales cyanobacterium CRU_2_2]|nr:DUF4112 domain-containing protein [Synechococcales cyanobacterium CRU_2_2]
MNRGINETAIYCFSGSTMLATESRAERLKHLRSLSHLLDNAIVIPGTKLRIGIDPILGLIPGLGDVSGVLFSAYIIVQAARWKLPTATLMKMLSNIGLDWLVGNVPLLGDFFDMGFKANARNVALLESHLNLPGMSRAADGWVVVLVFLALGLLLAVSVAIGGSILWGLFSGLSGLWGNG